MPDGLLLPGSVNRLIGSDGSGRSWIAAALASGPVARGEPVAWVGYCPDEDEESVTARVAIPRGWDSLFTNPLYLVHELNRLDKHRTLTVVSTVPEGQSVTIQGCGEGVAQMARVTLQPLHDGVEVFRLILSEPVPSVDWQPRLDSTQTFVMQTETTPYLPFPGDLLVLHAAVARVVDLLKPHATEKD